MNRKSFGNSIQAAILKILHEPFERSFLAQTVFYFDPDIDRIIPEFIIKIPRQLFCTVTFNFMLQLVFRQKTAEHGKEQHQKLPEIMSPFFSCSVGMCMYFHRIYFK